MQFNTEFVDFSEGTFPTGQGTWTISNAPSPATEIFTSSFDKITPSLRIYAPSSGSTLIKHTMLVSSPNFIEFRARTVTSFTNSFEIRFGTSSADYAGIRFSVSRTIEVCQGGGCASQTWTTCAPAGQSFFNYELNAWYRITIEVDYSSSNYPWRAFLNGIALSCGSLTLSGNLLTQMSLATTWGGASWSGAAIDDIKIYNNKCGTGCSGYGALNIAFDGLLTRQSIQLLDASGTMFAQSQQTSSGTIFLSFYKTQDAFPRYFETGDNTQTVVRIYAEDGTLEFQSPFTRFFVGERYTYTRPKAFADELVKTRSGGLYWPQYVWVDENPFCTGNISCYGLWDWEQSPQVLGALRGSYVHKSVFDYGIRQHWFTEPTQAIPNYFVTNVRIPSGKTPNGIGLILAEDISSHCTASVWPCWRQAYWGASPGNTAPNQPANPPGQENFDSQVYMGPLPPVRDQWIQLVVKSTDFSPGMISWFGFGYSIAGGEADWDVTTTQTDMSLTVSGLSAIAGSGLTVGVYRKPES